MATLTLQQFVETLEKSNLLSPGELAGVRSEAEQAGSATESIELARSLVDRKLLTRWQAEMLLAGRHAFFLGRYKLLERIGTGGMGSVFKAEQQPLGRLVAIKVMSRKLMKNEESVARFYREIQSAASLDHPNIVTAYDADRAGTTYFLVMEYVDGEDLGSIIKKRGALPPGEACSFIMQAAMGLQHAFERSLVHRDIKPSNLLVSRPPGARIPVVKVLDMGLARVTDLEVDGGLTQTGQIMGTPDYIAPEQARDSKAADIRSDIFSLGCTLYRLLTGRLPFGGTTLMEKLMARSNEDAPPVSDVRPEVPLPLDAVVARMIARDPGERYQTPAEVVGALVPFAATSAGTWESTEEVPPAAGSSATIDSGRPNRRADGVDRAETPHGPAADVAQTTPAPADSGLQQFLHDLDSEASFVQSSDSSTQSGEGATPSAVAAPFVPQLPGLPFGEDRSGGSADGDSPEGGQLVRSDAPAWTVGDDVRASSTLTAARGGRRQPAGSPWRLFLGVAAAPVLLAAAYLLWSWTGRTSVNVDWPEGERADAAISVDGRKVPLPETGPLRFSGSPGRRRMVLTRIGYEKIEKDWTLGRGEKVTFRPKWEPTPATIRRQELAVLRKQFQAIRRQQYDDAKVAPVRRALVEFRQRHPGSADAMEAAWLMWRLPWPVDRLRRSDVPEDALALTGAGNQDDVPEQLVAVIGDGRLSHNTPNVLAAVFSPDGKLVASGSGDETIRLWDAETGRLRRVVRVSTNGVTALAFSPDGTLIAGRNGNNTVGVWNVETGKLVQDFRGHAGNIRAVAFSPDGKTVASSDYGDIRIWNAQTGVQSFFLPVQAPDIGFSPDGKLLVTVEGKAGAIRLWSTESGEAVPTNIKGNGLMAVSAGGLVVCRSADLTSLVVWDLAGGGVQRKSIPLTGWTSPAISPDGKRLAVIHRGRIALFDVATGDKPAGTPDMPPFVAQSLSFSPDGNTLAAGLPDGTVRLIDVETGRERVEPSGHRGLITTLAVSPAGRLLATGGVDGTVRLWDLGGGKQVGMMTRRSPALALSDTEPAEGVDDIQSAHTGEVGGVEFVQGGRVLASAGDDGVIRLWNVADGKLLEELHGHFAPVLALAADPKGNVLASGGSDKNVRLWDARAGATGRELEVCEGHSTHVSAVAFSPDGRTLASCGYSGHLDGILLWDVSTGKKTAALKVDTKFRREIALTFSVGGEQIFSSAWGSSNNSIRVWDVGKRKIAREIPGTAEQARIVCQPQGRFFARSVGNGEIDVRDTHYFIEEQSLRFQPDFCVIGDVAYTPDGRHLVTGQGNGTICVLRLTEWSPDLDEKQEDIFP